MKRLQERNNQGSLHVNRSIIAVLVTLLATLAMVVPLGLSALSASQANAVDGQDETASRKPLLYRMMAFNDRIDTYQDELRMDFILRVKHNEFKPDCVDLGKADTGGKSNCNLSFVYQYVGSDNPADYHRVKYINTITPDDYLENNKTGYAYDGATAWADNHLQRFTVHKIINSGLYDYLTISIEGDMNIADKSKDPAKFVAGGHPEPLNVFAIVGDQNTTLSCGSSSWAWGTETCSTFDPASMSNLQDRYSNITASLSKDKQMKVYMGDCLGSGGDDLQCSGPYSWVGWDSNPYLYRNHQANWGMVTDYGFPAYSDGTVGNINATAPGTAPARSFFVYWMNLRGPGNKTNGICSETSSYYYQWVALKDSQWVPVKELTPEPVLVTGQQPSPNTLTTTYGLQGMVNTNGAYNVNPTDPKYANTTNVLFATDKDGNPMPAQKADGGIDFKEAKEKQDLDGYFKLVTWPDTRNSDGTECTAVSPEVYSPKSAGLVGIDDNMSAAQKDTNLSAGWTIDTAFYKYNVPRPDDPTITKIENDADAGLDASGSVYTTKLDPVISGECTPSKDDKHPNTVVLYGEDPTNPIADGQGTNGDDLVKSSDTWGFRLGEAVCETDTGSKQGGSWWIQDTNKQYPSPEPGNKYNSYRRYHAWVVESTSGFGLTSYFSNVGTAYFVSGENVPDAAKFSVAVPHTVNGSLPAGSVVTFKGEVSPVYTAWSSGSLGMTDSRMVVSMKQNAVSGWTSLVTTPANTFQRDAAVGTASSISDSTTGLTLSLTKTAASTWSWSLNIPADKFTGYNGDDETQTYTFQVEMVNPMNLRSGPASIERKIDMTPTTLTVDRHDVFQVAGRAYKYVDGDRKIPETKGTMVHVTWPDNTGTDVAVGGQGIWQAVPPEGMKQGDVAVQVLSDDAEGPDAQGRFQGGNQSASVSQELEFRPSTSSLPLTGGWPLSVLRILLLIALGLVGFVACLRNKQESRH